MDYIIGSVAALISGNVTPNRPKLIRRALTPTKHQPSPNVTPKSEFVEDRSIFMSPTQQKKKDIVKKSPKRIFQNPDLDTIEDCEGNSSVTSPKAEKVKKHLKNELESEEISNKNSPSLKSPNKHLDHTSDEVSPNKKAKTIDITHLTNNSTPKKKKKRNSNSNVLDKSSIDAANDNLVAADIELLKNTETKVKIPKIKKQKCKSVVDVANILNENPENENSPTERKISQSSDTTENKLESIEQKENQHKKKKNKKRKKKNKATLQSNTKQNDNIEDKENKLDKNQPEKQKNKKKNHKNKSEQIVEEKIPLEINQMEVDQEESESESEEVKSKNIPNPNAITEKDSDSEHDSDNEMESENDESNKEILTNENQEHESSDEEEKPQQKNKGGKKETKNTEEKEKEVMSEEEVKRTLFVGNVPFSNKCKKEIKKIFNKHGQIETVRIRTIPVKDARVTPKLAIIKNKLHPERTTVNVYVKFADASSVFKALAENNSVFNGNHLRVTRSGTTGAEHDPRLGVFVGNLPFALEDDTLRSKFEKCGEIHSVRIVRDKKTNAGKGFGYVNFASKDGVELALALSEEDLTIKNRILRVKRCTQGQGQGKKGGNAEGRGQGKWNQRGGVQGKWNPRGGVQGKWNQRETEQGEGAYRRVMNKRKYQDGGEGPPNKKQRNIHQPGTDKKPRKEFVGMTAEKKKKHKFNKGQKKKKALSEILTKKP